MHNGDTFASMSSESATSSNHGTENQGSPEFTEQLKLYKHHVPISPRAIYTFLRHTGRDDAPATGPAIIDKKRALRIRQLKTTKKLRRAPLPCDIIADILDNLAVFPTTTTDYGNILRHGVAGYNGSSDRLAPRHHVFESWVGNVVSLEVGLGCLGSLMVAVGLGRMVLTPTPRLLAARPAPELARP
eukprot:jgi/Tetstr1/455519/TSEL_042344.t2